MSNGKKNGGNAGGDNNNNNNNNNNGDGGNNNNNNNNGGGGGKNNNGGGGGGDYLNIVLKVDFHCEGCTKRIRKCLLSFPGVHAVSFEGETTVKMVAQKNVNAVKVMESLEKKLSKKVELVSPKPPKKEDQKKEDNKPPNDKKPKELPITTVVLKIPYHCKGCGEKTYKAVSSYKGVYEVIIDKEKDLVTVKGKVDAKEMVEILKKKLKKPVEIVPEKKNQKDKKDGDGDGEKKKDNSGGGGGKGGEKVMMCKCDCYSMVPYHGDVYGYGYAYGYGGYGPIAMACAEQWCSDENPNACTIM